MAHFAKINETSIVTQVVVGNEELEDKGHQFLIDTHGGTWIQTSYNSYGGVHYLPSDQLDETGNRIPSGQPHLRFNYAGIGYLYDPILDAFIPPVPHSKPEWNISWVLNPKTCLWEEDFSA